MPKKTSNFTEHAAEVAKMEESEESGSAYEASSDEAHSSPDVLPRSDSHRRSRTNTPSKHSKSTKKDNTKVKTEVEIFEDAAEWASKFQAPLSAEDVKTPPRKPARARPRSTRKTLKQAPNKVRAKRLKPYYSEDYRLLLNEVIQDAAASMLEEDEDSLDTSQIGSSIWTSSEKDVFFSALGRLGRDNLRGIAAKIGSKSEMEVHEYVLLLDEGVRERHSRNAKLLQSIEVPTALEISDECCAVLERAGDAITARHELASEKVDREKWGDSWLLTKDVSRWIEKRVRQKGGEDEIEEVLPAANLLNLANWLELSREIFMNPGPGHEDENWTSIAEPGETPAIRATAFEDFHSLAVNFTKRLLSTVLFCTMSRLRARDSHLVKHAEVKPDDVEAAVQILGLKSNSNEFWIDCARRCNLAVVDDEEDEDDDDDGSLDEGADGSFSSSSDEEEEEDRHMTYTAIEENLRSTIRPSRSRSRSVSRPPKAPEASQPLEHLISSPEDTASPEFSASIASAEEEFSSDGERFPLSSTTFPSEEAERVEALEDAQDSYAETMDMHTSNKEEARLWKMLQQTAPFEVGTEPLDGLKRPKSLPIDTEGRQWRNGMQYVNAWETLETPALGAAFQRNRTRLSRKGKRKASEAFSDSHGDRRGEEEQVMDEVVSELDDENDAGQRFEEALYGMGTAADEDPLTEALYGGDEELEDAVMEQPDAKSPDSQTSFRGGSQFVQPDDSDEEDEEQEDVLSPSHPQRASPEWDFEREHKHKARERSIDSE